MTRLGGANERRAAECSFVIIIFINGIIRWSELRCLSIEETLEFSQVDKGWRQHEYFDAEVLAYFIA